MDAGVSRSSTPPAENPEGSALRLAGLVAVAVTAIAVVLLGLRLRFGIDVIDESYYAAGAYRFALGMRPLLDDLGPHQFASFVASPIVWLWLRWRGGLDGVVLALRVTYFAASLLAATASFSFLRRIVDWRIALVASACSLGFVPLLIFAPSYNTIALLSISVGTSLAGIGLRSERRPWMFVLSGIVLTVAAVAYPTLWLVVVAAIVLLGVVSRSWKASALMAAGAALTTAAFAIALTGTFSGVSAFVTYNRFLSEQAGWLTGLRKVAVLAKGVVGETYLAPAAWLIVVVVGFRVLRRRVPTALTVLLPISTLLVLHVGAPVGRTMVVSTLLLLAVFASGISAVGPASRRALNFALGVGLAAAALIAFTSAGGFFSFGYGAASVAAPALAVLLNNARAALSRRANGARATMWAVVVGTVMVCGITAMCWEATYPWGPSPLNLHAQGSGAFAGIIGEPGLASATSRMESDLRRTTSPADGLLMYGSTPSAYILSPARPVAPFLWMSPADGSSKPRADFIVSWMQTSGHTPSVVVVDAGLWNSRNSAKHDYLLDYFGRRYTPVIANTDYVILRAR